MTDLLDLLNIADDTPCDSKWCPWPARWHDPVTHAIELPTDPVYRAAGDEHSQAACCLYCHGEGTVHQMIRVGHGGHGLTGPWARTHGQCARQRFQETA